MLAPTARAWVIPATRHRRGRLGNQALVGAFPLAARPIASLPPEPGAAGTPPPDDSDQVRAPLAGWRCPPADKGGNANVALLVAPTPPTRSGYQWLRDYLRPSVCGRCCPRRGT